MELTSIGDNLAIIDVNLGTILLLLTSIWGYSLNYSRQFRDSLALTDVGGSSVVL